ncbi:MAG: hypothetical protein CMK07_09780 [Ponticaulis sp.]|nr:hypothetical protein [Ponticaulis sp.]
MSELLRQVHFLIAEDDEVDILALKRILIDLDQDIAFSIAHDGSEVLSILRENVTKGDEAENFIVLLDLNMPRMNGHEFLEELRKDESIADTVVFVLSTSVDPRDINRTYQHHVSGYIPKDRLEASSFRKLFESYLELNSFPQRPGG